MEKDFFYQVKERDVRLESSPPPDVCNRTPAPVEKLVVEALNDAVLCDLADPPTRRPVRWGDKTGLLISKKWEEIPPPARRAVVVLSYLGQAFPECATLEAIVRGIARERSFNPHSAFETLLKFQDRSKGRGSRLLVDVATVTPLVLPVISLIEANDEREALLTMLSMLPVLLLATKISSSSQWLEMSDGQMFEVDLEGDKGKGWTVEHRGLGSATGRKATPEEIQAARLQRGLEECRRRGQHQPQYQSPTQASCERCGKKLW